MKLFIYEHITSGALSGNSLPVSLANEGHAMLMAVLHDCAYLNGMLINTMRDQRLKAIEFIDDHPQHNCHFISTQTQYAQCWQHCLDIADAVLIIAPETDNLLVGLQQQALAANKLIIGCQPNAIKLATDKNKCNEHLIKHSIAVVETTLAYHWLTTPFTSPPGYILKPTDGAGCINTYYFNNSDELQRHLSSQELATLHRLIVQPYVEGISASLSLLASNDDIEVLAINRQNIAQFQQQLKVTSCTINDLSAIPLSIEKASKLAQQIHKAIPGLWGHIGIDLIVTDSSAFVTDINPRLTSSYIGLSSSLNINPMSRLFEMKKNTLSFLPPITQRNRIEVKL